MDTSKARLLPAMHVCRRHLHPREATGWLATEPSRETCFSDHDSFQKYRLSWLIVKMRGQPEYDREEENERLGREWGRKDQNNFSSKWGHRFSPKQWQLHAQVLGEHVTGHLCAHKTQRFLKFQRQPSAGSRENSLQNLRVYLCIPRKFLWLAFSEWQNRLVGGRNGVCSMWLICELQDICCRARAKSHVLHILVP